MEREWIKTKKKLPRKGQLVLVKAPALHSRIALGILEGEMWDVQPFKEAWYQTDHTHIDEWSLIEDKTISPQVKAIRKAIVDILQEASKIEE